MKVLLKVLREILYTLGIIFVASIAGNILYRVIGDLSPSAGLDRSVDATKGASLLFALLALIVISAIRLFRRRRRRKPPQPKMEPQSPSKVQPHQPLPQATIGPTRTCAKCGAPTSVDDAFCMKCGKPIEVEEIVAKPPAEATAMRATSTVEAIAPVGRKRRGTVVVVAAAVVMLAAIAGGFFLWVGSGKQTLAYVSAGASRAEFESAAGVLNRRLAHAGQKGEARVDGELILVTLKRASAEDVVAIDELLRRRGALELLPIAGPASDGASAARENFISANSGRVAYQGDGTFTIDDAALDDVKRQISEAPPPPPLQIVVGRRETPGPQMAWLVDRSHGLRSLRIESANAVAESSGAWTVQIEFAQRSVAVLGLVSEQYYGKLLVWTLDGEFLIAPVMWSPIGKSAQISGGFDEAEARRLANILASGTLPIELHRVAAPGNS